MIQAFILGIITLIGACAARDNVEGKFPEFVAQAHLRENDETKKEGTLSPKFIECPHSYYWSTQPFTSESLDYKAAIAERKKFGPSRSGFYSGLPEHSPSSEDFDICVKIFEKVINEPVDHEMLQLFDAQEVIKITKNDNDFHIIEPQTAYLINISYREDKETGKKVPYSIYVPLSVKCENDWTVKQYFKWPYLTFFQQPKGRCHFSSNDYKLELSSSQIITVVINGYYQLDPMYPDKNMIIEIEKYGFIYDS